jgi:hypothetical protein
MQERETEEIILTVSEFSKKVFGNVFCILPNQFFNPWKRSICPALGMKGHHYFIW